MLVYAETEVEIVLSGLIIRSRKKERYAMKLSENFALGLSLSTAILLAGAGTADAQK
jgi:hypothetical protein